MNARDKNEVIPSARLEKWRRVWDILLATDEEPRVSDERTESGEESHSKDAQSVSLAGQANEGF